MDPVICVFLSCGGKRERDELLPASVLIIRNSLAFGLWKQQRYRAPTTFGKSSHWASITRWVGRGVWIGIDPVLRRDYSKWLYAYREQNKLGQYRPAGAFENKTY